MMKKFENKVWLSSPTMHGDEELKWVEEAIRTNWVSTVGANINYIEEALAKRLNVGYAVALSCGTAALHLAVKLAAERFYGMPKANQSALTGKTVFCSDMTFAATANPLAYENAKIVFIDSERDTWNIDPAALEKAFTLYQETKIVMLAHLYGTPAKFNEIKAICDKYGAVIIEDAAEALGAAYRTSDGQMKAVGALGDYNCISFNGNKIITGSSGGMFLTNSKEDADKVRKWSTQSREAAAWYEHEELGYNYRMSNLLAGVIRGQIPFVNDIKKSKAVIYARYKEGFKDLPVSMNPYDEAKSEPNFWLSCMLINEDAMCRQIRSGRESLYIHESGKSCPTEILEKLAEINAEGRPIWKPMHMQPIYRNNPFITAQGNGRAKTNAYIEGGCEDVGMDIFQRGLCLPSDNKMTAEEQDYIIEVIRGCFE